MSRAPVCINPIVIRDKIDEAGFNIFADYERIEAINQVKPYTVDWAICSKCAGSCIYCVLGSDTSQNIILPKEKIMEVIDDSWEMGVRLMFWGGGDIFFHPDWYECISYAADKGMKGILAMSGMMSKEDAKKIARLEPSLSGIGVHIDTVVQEAYNKVHTNPKTLQAKMRGYQHLLEAGCPPDKMVGLITFTRHVAPTIEETLDWYIDTMGSRSITLCIFKSEGFGAQHKSDLEPSLQEVKRAIEYRAKKLGSHWLKIGSSDGSQFYCRANIFIGYRGEVSPCGGIADSVCGNIYEERLPQIFEKHRDWLMFNFKVEGPCSDCSNSDICFGCRASAYHYLDDIKASDPKCFLNPDAHETYFR